ncbi:helix-turn-helix transcriptional regulator, partial [Escherichia coli]|nr:helix-turn-helix transcriptional regulator [Escherichia coli]
AGMSPLRYQKWLRLNEVRRTMLNEHYDVTTAAYAVGYESLSHFRREYLRMFGERTYFWTKSDTNRRTG